MALNKRDFVQQFVLNRAIARRDSFGAIDAAESAVRAWEYIEAQCKKDWESIELPCVKEKSDANPV